MERTEQTKEDEEDIDNPGGDGVSLPGVEETGVRHATALLGVAGDVPLDVSRSILAAHYRTLRATHTSGRQRLAGGFIQCPSCSTPWIAGLCKPRLLGCPRSTRAHKGRLRRIIRRAQTRPGKLTSREKSLLSRYQNRENVIEVSCLVCRHKKRESFPLPEKRIVEEEPEGIMAPRKRKKKKKKVKELNAGLHITTPYVERDKPSTVFTTVAEDAQDSNTPKVPPHLMNTSAHPRFKPKAKVLLGNEPRSVVLHPASFATPGAARQRKKTLSDLKRIMSVEKAKRDEGKKKNSLGSFLESLI